MKIQRSQNSNRIRRAASLYQVLVIVLALFGLLLGPVFIHRTALAETTAVADTAVPDLISESQPELAELSSTPGGTAVLAITGTEQAISAAQANIVSPLLGVCTQADNETRCAPLNGNGRVAGDVPPELVATLRGEPSPIRVENQASPSFSSATLIVDTPDMVINGDVSSITKLLANRGPDGISFLEALTAVNNSGDGHTIQFAPAL
ncbi:MAG: hypothetical protein ACE5EY_06090, partial [Anaerolineae bacterium]